VSGLLNTGVMVTLAFLGGSGLYLLFKYRRRVVKHVFGFVFGMITIVAVFFFVEEILGLVEFINGLSLEFYHKMLVGSAIAIPLSLFTAKAAISEGITRRNRNIALVTLGTLAGALMATVTPVFMAFPLFLGLAAYDVYAVKRGPIKKIVSDYGVFNFMVAYEAEDWSLGLGDVVFYSMLPSSSLVYTMTHISRFTFYDSSILVGILIPWLVFIAVAGAVVIGFKKTLKIMERRLISGLCIPILLGCVFFGFCILTLQLVNYLGWSRFIPLL